MGLHRPRHGSLQFWPRKRARKELPSVNWRPLERKTVGSKGILGMIGYKAGMISVLVKDNTLHSQTKGKQIVIPATIIECPKIKILGIRFYKAGKTAIDILADDIDKELKKIVKIPKAAGKGKLEGIKTENYDNIRLLVYTLPKKVEFKTSNIAEVGLEGNLNEKLNFAKSILGKEISIKDIFEKGKLVDIHSVTKGKGFTGPVKRFGLHLKAHKSEKGVRRPGSLGPWHPARVTWRAPLAGQMGYFTRVHYNNKILEIDSAEKIAHITLDNFGKIKNDYLIVKGSVGGPAKRAIFMVYAARPTKHTSKEAFEIVKIQ